MSEDEEDGEAGVQSSQRISSINSYGTHLYIEIKREQETIPISTEHKASPIYNSFVSCVYIALHQHSMDGGDGWGSDNGDVCTDKL